MYHYALYHYAVYHYVYHNVDFVFISIIISYHRSYDLLLAGRTYSVDFEVVVNAFGMEEMRARQVLASNTLH